jgi:UDP-2-acetamido-2,6-beta-L-arabino-hexul-4-ose reductase
MKVLITGAKGFIGKNLSLYLKNHEDLTLFCFDLENSKAELDNWLHEADFVYHLAGVNRPQNEDEFFTGNADFTTYICHQLAERKNPPPLLLSSSIQAELDNAYGRSKRLAEQAVEKYSQQTGAPVFIYRLTNVFGKWSRPNYNTVVATFCHNIARDLPITISDPNHEIQLIHIDDVVRTFISELEISSSDQKTKQKIFYKQVSPSYPITLGDLAALIRSFRQSRQTLLLPDFSNPFVFKLYGMYLSYLENDQFAYDLTQRCDERGCLAEFIKSPCFGQIFVSRTKPGITRGNHFHHSKAEKFLVLEGEAVVRFRPVQQELANEIIEYHVSGTDFRVLDIPPGYTHNIENVGDSELITLFWASEVFDPEGPDTYYEMV